MSTILIVLWCCFCSVGRILSLARLARSQGVTMLLDFNRWINARGSILQIDPRTLFRFPELS
jgi:hypothetical protein